MKTKRMFLLIGAAALSLTTTPASAATHASQMMTPAMARPAPRFAPRTMMGTRQRWNDRDNDRDDRFRRFHDRTFIFFDAFGFPFFYPYPYGYYPYDYGYNNFGYDYGYTVVEVQRRLARAGYYRGPIDGIMGPRTRRAIRAYERDHNMPAWGIIDRQRVATTDLG
jgi:Putative peptidoglycan binding domain